MLPELPAGFSWDVIVDQLELADSMLAGGMTQVMHPVVERWVAGELVKLSEGPRNYPTTAWFTETGRVAAWAAYALWVESSLYDPERDAEWVALNGLRGLAREIQHDPTNPVVQARVTSLSEYHRRTLLSLLHGRQLREVRDWIASGAFTDPPPRLLARIRDAGPVANDWPQFSNDLVSLDVLTTSALKQVAEYAGAHTRGFAYWFVYSQLAEIGQPSGDVKSRFAELMDELQALTPGSGLLDNFEPNIEDALILAARTQPDPKAAAARVLEVAGTWTEVAGTYSGYGCEDLLQRLESIDAEPAVGDRRALP